MFALIMLIIFITSFFIVDYCACIVASKTDEKGDSDE